MRSSGWTMAGDGLVNLGYRAVWPRQERGGEGPPGKRAGDDDELENKSWRVYSTHT